MNGSFTGKNICLQFHPLKRDHFYMQCNLTVILIIYTYVCVYIFICIGLLILSEMQFTSKHPLKKKNNNKIKRQIFIFFLPSFFTSTMKLFIYLFGHLVQCLMYKSIWDHSDLQLMFYLIKQELYIHWIFVLHKQGIYCLPVETFGSPSWKKSVLNAILDG